ncbi:MAG: hypothetical protein K0U72_16955 [Gammaproteobacteria bacterium]|nr:hypothetical protein [Gammaproteobacteria bacterium]
MLSVFKRLIMPGLVFQSIGIAGGYGTGRELVEFFLQYGPVGGLLGIVIPATLVISFGCAISFELTRMSQSYDYRKFLKELLGRGWFLYEIAYLFTVLLVVAVVTAAIGTLVTETFGIPANAGSIALLLAVAFLVFKGTEVIEGVMSVWSLVLYGVYGSIFVASMYAFGSTLGDSFALPAENDGWFFSGVRYAGLMLSLIPAILFATTHIKTRRDAVLAGMLTGPLYLIPAVLFFLALVPHYPLILERPVPVNYVLELLDLRWLQMAFVVMLIGTFVETGSGMIHAVNERIAGTLEAVGKEHSPRNRAFVALLLLIAAFMISSFGMIELIGRGYGALSWAYLIILVVPLFTVGIWKVVKGVEKA